MNWLATLTTKEGSKPEMNVRAYDPKTGKHVQRILNRAVQLWPTPAARDYRSPNKLTYEERGGGKKGEQLPNAAGGQLNPMWVEWLMGWPLGWTDLKPLETDKFRSAPQQHGACLEAR
jgi:hypothetical protein